MNPMTVAALAVTLSLDGLGVGAVYGLRRIRLPRSLYVVVALCTGGLMALSMGLGGHLGLVFDPRLTRRVGGLVLVAVGLWQLAQSWQAFRRSLAGPDHVPIPRPLLRFGLPRLGLIVEILVQPAAADVDASGHIDLGESLALGLALGLDALGAGLGVGLLGCPPVAVPLVALTCALFVRAGLAAAGHPLARRLAQRVSVLPGVLLILLGLLRL